MRRALPLLLLAFAFSGCAFRRDSGFAWQRLTGRSVRRECFRDGPAGVCRWRPQGLEEDPDATLFFLHYATGDERSVARVGVLQAFYRRYQKAGRRPPRVFSVSYGEHWLVSAHPGRFQVVARADFEDLLRRLEKTRSRRRYLWGMSMGGYNAAEEALSSPQNWTAAVLSCPALLTANPFDTSLIGLSAKRRDGLDLFTRRLSDARVWDEEDPVILAHRLRPEAEPAYYIEANAHDEFNFLPGAHALADALAEGGKPVIFRELPGGHCAVNGAAAADFFISHAAENR